MIFNILILRLYIYYIFIYIVFFLDFSYYNGISIFSLISRYNVFFEDYIKDDKDYIDDFIGLDDFWDLYEFFINNFVKIIVVFFILL